MNQSAGCTTIYKYKNYHKFTAEGTNWHDKIKNGMNSLGVTVTKVELHVRMVGLVDLR